MKTFTVFPGNRPRNVSKDAKYSVRGTDGRVGLRTPPRMTSVGT